MNPEQYEALGVLLVIAGGSAVTGSVWLLLGFAWALLVFGILAVVGGALVVRAAALLPEEKSKGGEA